MKAVMLKMNHWAHRLFPKLPFDGTLDIIANRLGKSKVSFVVSYVCCKRFFIVSNENSLQYAAYYLR